MKNRDDARATKNQEFDKDVKEFDFIITQLVSAFYEDNYNTVASSKKKGKIQTTVDISKIDIDNFNYSSIPETGDCYSILDLWNNTVTDYRLELKHLSGFINSNRFQTFILIIKDSEFVYGSAIPLGISSIIGGVVFAIPDKLNSLSLIILARILFNIAIKIFSNFTSALIRDSGDLLQIMAAIFVAIKLNISVNRNSFFRERFKISPESVAELLANTVISSNNYDEKIKDDYKEKIVNILLKAIDEYYYYSVDDERIVRHLFYENGAMKYIVESSNKDTNNISESVDNEELQKSNE